MQSLKNKIIDHSRDIEDYFLATTDIHYCIVIHNIQHLYACIQQNNINESHFRIRSTTAKLTLTFDVEIQTMGFKLEALGKEMNCWFCDIKTDHLSSYIHTQTHTQSELINHCNF